MNFVKTVLLFSALFLSFKASSQEKLTIDRLTADVAVFTTYGVTGGTKFPANGLLVNTSEGVVIIDSPWDKTQFQPLLDSIQKIYGKKAIACIATHSHEDRTAGLEYYSKKGIKTFTTRNTDSILALNNENRPEFTFENDTTFIFGERTIEAFYPGPGHTTDNIVIWLPGEKLLYGGCFIKSTEANDLGNLNDAKPIAWDKSIKKVKKRYPKQKYVIPGHQSWESRKSLKHTQKLVRKFNRSQRRGA